MVKSTESKSHWINILDSLKGNPYTNYPYFEFISYAYIEFAEIEAVENAKALSDCLLRGRAITVNNKIIKMRFKVAPKRTNTPAFANK